MADVMAFPDTWEEFEQYYGFTDVEQVYTNGSRLIQSFRVKQWLDHISAADTDTISRRDAIQAIARTMILSDVPSAELVIPVKKIIDAIVDKYGEVAPRIFEQQWIPCSERLPEEDFWSGKERQFSNNVLVTIVNHAYDDEQVIDIAQTVDGIWKISHDVDGYYSLPNWCEVIAWMPLPEPYKGEEDE